MFLFKTFMSVVHTNYLTFKAITLSENQTLENVWVRNLHQYTTNDSPSNILWIEILFQSYLQKWPRSRWHLSRRSPGLNLITLRAAKTGLTILEIFYFRSHFLENIWRRNVDPKSNNNSPSISLRTFALFPSYFQKHESSRWYFL